MAFWKSRNGAGGAKPTPLARVSAVRSLAVASMLAIAGGMVLVEPARAAMVEEDNTVLADTPTYMGDSGDWEVWLTGMSNGDVWLTFYDPATDESLNELLTPDDSVPEEFQRFAIPPPFVPDPTKPTIVWFPNLYGPGRHGYHRYPPGVNVTPPGGYVGVGLNGSNSYYPQGYEPRLTPTSPQPGTPRPQPRPTIGPITVIAPNNSGPIVIAPNGGNITIQMPGGGTQIRPVTPPPNPVAGQPPPQIIEETTLPNGTIRQRYPNGTVVHILPNGTVIVWPGDPTQPIRVYTPGTYPGQP